MITMDYLSGKVLRGIHVNIFRFRDEYSKLYDFVTQKKLRVKNIGGKMVRNMLCCCCQH